MRVIQQNNNIMYNLNDQIILYLILQISENQTIDENNKEYDLHNYGFSTHFFDHYLINFFLLKTTCLDLK